MTLQGEVIESVDGLIAIESEWWTLWREVPAATPFQSPAWLIPWWQAFAPGELLTVALRTRGRLVALAPLYLESGALGRRLLPLGIGISDYLDVLLAPGRDDVAAALTDCCCRLTARWEVLELGELSANAAALGVPCPAQCTEIADRQSACPTMLLGDGTDESGLPFEVPGKRRQSYRRRRRAAEAAGGLEILAPGPDAFLEALTQLHARRWQAKGEPGVLADPRVREFHRLALPRLLGAGLARCTVARIGGRLAGAYYRLCWPGHGAAYLGGFDPEFRETSPMTILIGEGLREAVREGAREFSFLRGREEYKYFWGATDRWNQRRSFRRLV